MVEPELAALLFYGALRLLPDVPWTQAVSFCTFEPNPDARCTTLAATYFHDPAGELPPRPTAGRRPCGTLSRAGGRLSAAGGGLRG